MRTTPQQPNILFVCSDQQNWSKNSVNGHPLVQTPNMQRLAEMGTNFTSCYSNCPVCAPARASMFTGRYPFELGTYDNAAPLQPGYPTFGSIARDCGYLTWATGKLDFCYNGGYGFEEHNTSHGHDPSPDITAFTRSPVRRRPQDMGNVQEVEREGDSKDRSATDLTLEFLRSRRAGESQPWLAWCGWNAPHNPYKTKKEYLDLYPLDKIDMPYLPEGWRENEHPAWRNTRIQRCCDIHIPDERIRRDRAAYYGMITELDEQLGELLDALEETGQADNTVVIFTSDHGDMMGEHGFFYKYAPYEDAAKVPLIMAGPGIEKNKTVNTPVSLVDVFATIVDIVGEKPPAGCRGTSLLPVNREENAGPAFVFMELNTERVDTGVFTVVEGNWKYNYYVGYQNQLFNLAEDRYEWDNRVEDPACEHIRRRLHDTLLSVCDPEKVNKEAFEDQKRRLIAFTGSDRRSYEDVLADEECLRQFTRRLGEEGAKDFLRQHFEEMQKHSS